MDKWSFADLQEEQIAWVTHNFPGRSSWMPLLGMVEEVCDELIEAEEAFPINRPLIGDALADAVIFMSDFCTAMGLDIESVHRMALRRDKLQQQNGVTLVKTIGKLAHRFLKMTQKIRGSEPEHRAAIASLLVDLMDDIQACADFYELDLVVLVQNTWAEVKKRDWIKYPFTGHPEEHNANEK